MTIYERVRELKSRVPIAITSLMVLLCISCGGNSISPAATFAPLSPTRSPFADQVETPLSTLSPRPATQEATPTAEPLVSPTPRPSPTAGQAVRPSTVLAMINGAGAGSSDPFRLEPGLTTFTMLHTGADRFYARLVTLSTGERVSVLIDLEEDVQASRILSIDRAGEYVIEVRAEGDWSIEVARPSPDDSLQFDSPQQFTGSGTQAIYYLRLVQGLHKFSLSHDGVGDFIVRAYSADGSETQGLVNETGRFDGSTNLDVSGDALYVLDVRADGNWTISVN